MNAKLAPIFVIALVGACGGSDPEEVVVDPIVARGEYLAEHVAGCGNCHTPQIDGVPDPARKMAGVFERHPVPNVGKVNSANLTSDESGLKSWTDDEIKRAIREGIGKGGRVLWFNMPYYELANLTDTDVTAIVAYLRTLPPVVNVMTQLPYTLRTTPFLPITGELVPRTTLPATDARFASAERGRYLASFGCLHCHTPNLPTGDYRRDPARVFAGNLKFDVTPYVPKEAFSSNLTPHEHGIKELDVEQVKEAITRSGDVLCKPMASLSKNFLSGMTDADATDLANYFTTLPPVDSGEITTCMR